MRSSLLFFIGFANDALIMIIVVLNLLIMNESLQNFPEATTVPADGFSDIGRLLLWVIPIVLAILIGTAFWLRSAGKMLAANILLWIPALPMAGGIVLWGGLAMLFMFFGASN